MSNESLNSTDPANQVRRALCQYSRKRQAYVRTIVDRLSGTDTYRTICVKLISGAASANQDDRGHDHGPIPTQEWDLRSLPMPRVQFQIPRPSAGTDQVDFGIRPR